MIALKARDMFASVDRYVEDALGLIAILVLLPIMLLIVLPATLFFDPYVGLFRRA